MRFAGQRLPASYANFYIANSLVLVPVFNDPNDRIALETPIERGWEPVFRLVLGGVADRLDLGFEDLDDVQLAVERLLAEAGTQETVKLSFDILPEGLRTSIGPLRERAIAEALTAN